MKNLEFFNRNQARNFINKNKPMAIIPTGSVEQHLNHLFIGMDINSATRIAEDLAKKLNAATACSKPVSDAGWRPHHEHVGHTGLKISPKIYFAIGISGAIQHLAGINSSKTIVVINNDPEAPFFKAADYGIVGDAFEVVPKILNFLG